MSPHQVLPSPVPPDLQPEGHLLPSLFQVLHTHQHGDSYLRPQEGKVTAQMPTLDTARGLRSSSPTVTIATSVLLRSPLIPDRTVGEWEDPDSGPGLAPNPATKPQLPLRPWWRRPSTQGSAASPGHSSSWGCPAHTAPPWSHSPSSGYRPASQSPFRRWFQDRRWLQSSPHILKLLGKPGKDAARVGGGLLGVGTQQRLHSALCINLALHCNVKHHLDYDPIVINYKVKEIRGSAR